MGLNLVEALSFYFFAIALIVNETVMIISSLFVKDGLEQDPALTYRQTSNNMCYRNRYHWILASICRNSEDDKSEMEINPTLLGHWMKRREMSKVNHFRAIINIYALTIFRSSVLKKDLVIALSETKRVNCQLS